MSKQPIGGPPMAGGMRIPLSRAMRAGDFVFCSGWMSLDEHGQIVGRTIEEQTRKVIEDLRDVLAEAGCTLQDVVKVMAWLADPRDFGGFNRAYAEYFPTDPPARSAVGTMLIFDAKLDLEMNAYKPQ
jgi:reactive intermediate/imine deaminase